MSVLLSPDGWMDGRTDGRTDRREADALDKLDPRPLPSVVSKAKKPDTDGRAAAAGQKTDLTLLFNLGRALR